MKLRRPSPFILLIAILILLLVGGLLSIKDHVLVRRTEPDAVNLAATELTDTVSAPAQQADDSHDAEGARALAALALSLMQNDASVGEGANALVSPLSIASALGLAANGAEGETLQQMETVLGMDVGSLNAYLNAQRTRTASDAHNGKGNPAVTLSNSIWIRDTPEFEASEAFLQDAVSWYGASVFSAPFDDSTVRDINAWVRAGTNDMIDGILDEGSPISEEAIMFLVNALAFEAAWEDPIDDGFVETASFTCEDGSEQDVELMYSFEDRYFEMDLASGAVAENEEESTAIADGERLVGFAKPYQGGTYAFVALLPPEGTTVFETVAQLSGDTLATLLESSWYTPVEAYLPAFSYDYSTQLDDTLKALGMVDAFNPNVADFSGMGDGLPLNISRVLHKTHIEVDQEGTGAAAATIVEMEAGSSAPGEEIPPKVVRLDRPFIYLIVDTRTNTPLFVGTLMQP